MRQFFYWLPTFVWMGLIFYLSSQATVRVSSDFAIQFLVFKSLHVIEYAFLYILMYRSLRNTRNSPEWEVRYNAWLLTVAYAMTDEIHQVFVPTREGKLRDVAIDVFGITIASIYLWKFLPKAPKILKTWAKKLRVL